MKPIGQRTLALAIVVTVALPLAGCGDRGNGRPIHASGHIEATEVRLAAKVGGRLAELPFQEGAAVDAGAVVARFDTVDAEHELTRGRAELAAADARLRLLLAGSRSEDVRQAGEELARAQAELDAATRDRERFEGLAERGTATVKARDDARTRQETARRAVQGSQAALDRLIAGARPEEIEAARAARDVAAAVVATIEQRIADLTVTAPRAGVITRRSAEPGEVLAAGAPLSVLTDLAEPWLTVYVDEPSLARVRLGDEVTVRVDGRDESYRGRVSYVAEVAEFTPKNVQTPDERAKLVFKVKVALDNRDGVFKPGMPADAYFASSQPPRGEGRGERVESENQASLPLPALPSPLSALPFPGGV
ncbi:MAG: ybhG [Acidobacteria bacterium]|jgi:HlyD family secretion protein|nr:ybhG [Acidobacteriota bacterium]